MLLKTKNGSSQSTAFQVPRPLADLNNFKNSGKIVQIFPENFYLEEPLSLLVKADKLWVDGQQTGLAGEDIYLHSGLNNFDPEATVEANMGNAALMAKTKMSPIGDNIYKIDMIPMDYYNVDDTYIMENIEFLFPTKDWVKVGFDEGGSNFIILAPGALPDPDPEFYFFPQRFTQLDALTLVRTNNEKSSAGLEYTITANGKTITGDFTGSRSELKASINLMATWGNDTSLDKIHLSVSHKDGAEIINTDIPLVPLSELQ